jgi:Lrp/AsnC ligand binding domain
LAPRLSGFTINAVNPVSGTPTVTRKAKIQRRRDEAARRRRQSPSGVRVALPGTHPLPHTTTGFEALVWVRTGPTTSPEQFVAYLANEPAVAQVWRVGADIDAVVRLTCASLSDLEAVVRMRHRGGAEHTVTHLVLPAATEPKPLS